MCRKQRPFNTWKDTLKITKEDLESMGLTTNPTDLVLEVKIEDTHDTQDCDRHNKTSGGVHICRDRNVQPSPDDLDNKIHPTTLPTPGGVPAKGEETEVVSRTDTSGDSSVGESMSVRQGTHLPSELNDRCNTAQPDRSVKEIYPGYMVIREDTMDTNQDTNPPDSGWEDKS